MASLIHACANGLCVPNCTLGRSGRRSYVSWNISVGILNDHIHSVALFGGGNVLVATLLPRQKDTDLLFRLDLDRAVLISGKTETIEPVPASLTAVGQQKEQCE
jgi:hypothetical protein